MSIAIPVLVICYYVSIALELIFLSVPSPSSTKALLSTSEGNKLALISSHLLSLLAFLFPLYLAIKELICGNATEVCISLVLLGMLLIFVGRTYTLLGTLSIRKHLKEESSTVLSKKIFSISRHPIATGLMLSLVGLCLVFNHIILYILTLYFVVYMHKKVLIEEGKLIQTFAQEYEDYKEGTRRYL